MGVKPGLLNTAWGCLRRRWIYKEGRGK